MALVEKSSLPLNALNGVHVLVSSCGPTLSSFGASSHVSYNSNTASSGLSTNSLNLPSLKDVLASVGLTHRPPPSLPSSVPTVRSALTVAPVAPPEGELNISAAIGALTVADREENPSRSRLPHRSKPEGLKDNRRNAPYSFNFESSLDPHTYSKDLDLRWHCEDAPIVKVASQDSRPTQRAAFTQPSGARRRATQETYYPVLDLKIVRHVDLGDQWDLNVTQTHQHDEKGAAIYQCLNPDVKAPGTCLYMAAKQTVKRHVHTVHLELRPYVCVFRDPVTGEACNASFSQKSAFRIHRDGVHTGEKRHACTVCGTMFSDPSKRNKHMGFEHPGVKTKKWRKHPYRCLANGVQEELAGGLR